MKDKKDAKDTKDINDKKKKRFRFQLLFRDLGNIFTVSLVGVARVSATGCITGRAARYLRHVYSTDSNCVMTAVHLSAPDIDPSEVEYFEKLAHRWWDDEGPFWPLHKLNSFRAEFVRDQLCRAFGRDPQADKPLEGLRVLDIGCGGGILSESVARMGASVTGTEITEKNIRVAQIHADWSGLDIDYRLITADDLAASGETFDAVLNMEVVEHVEHLPDFLASCARLVRPGGVMVVATINRTPIAWFMAIFGAEYVLRWLPKGTHHYRKLVKPAELTAGLGDEYQLLHRTGVRVNPFNRAFSFTGFEGVNYMMLFQREQGA